MSEVTFYFDFSSPFAYLASTQIERVAAEAGGQVRWNPILLGGLFKAIGTPNVPLFTMTEARRRYVARDLQHWADHWGITLRWPSRFPMNTVAPLRLLLAAGDPVPPSLVHAIYRAYWVEDRDIADPQVLVALAGDASLVERTADPAIKARLIASTTDAAARGIFGVPSFLVGDQLIFGQDRLDFVGAALRGETI